MKLRSPWTALLGLVLAGVPRPAAAQAVEGRIVDVEGVPVAEATVILLDAQYQPVTDGRTDSDGRYRLVATFRGDRSFWIKNLHKRPEARFYIGGKAQDSDAIVLAPEFNNLDEWDLGGALTTLTRTLKKYVGRGWAFAVLVPAGS